MAIELETAETQIDTIGVQAAMDAFSALTEGMGTFEATKEIPDPPAAASPRRPAVQSAPSPLEAAAVVTPDWRTDATPPPPQRIEQPPPAPPPQPAVQRDIGLPPPITAPREERAAHAQATMQQQPGKLGAGSKEQGERRGDNSPAFPPSSLLAAPSSAIQASGPAAAANEPVNLAPLLAAQARTNDLLTRILTAVDRPYPKHPQPTY